MQTKASQKQSCIYTYLSTSVSRTSNVKLHVTKKSFLHFLLHQCHQSSRRPRQKEYLSLLQLWKLNIVLGCLAMFIHREIFNTCHKDFWRRFQGRNQTKANKNNNKTNKMIKRITGISQLSTIRRRYKCLEGAHKICQNEMTKAIQCRNPQLTTVFQILFLNEMKPDNNSYCP